MSAFHLFPQLPKELQYHIWSIILHEPRTITLKPNSNLKRISFTTTQPPVLLQVTSESRREALRYYSRYFRDRRNGVPIRPELRGCTNTTQADGIFLNPRRDIVAIRDKDIDALSIHDVIHGYINYGDLERLCLVVTEHTLSRGVSSASSRILRMFQTIEWFYVLFQSKTTTKLVRLEGEERHFEWPLKPAIGLAN